jgi:hypothetical protein
VPALTLTPPPVPAESTNDLTKDFLKALTEAYPDALAYRNNRLNAKIRKNGKTRHVNAGINGQGDITATIPITFNGRKFGVRFDIEIKFGPDTQSLNQKIFEAALTRASGVYLIVRDVEQGIAELTDIVARMSE